MTNLDELAEELNARAEAGAPPAGPGGQMARLTGVRHRMQVRRRRRAGVAVVAAALLIGGAAWHPGLSRLTSDQQVPSKVSQLDTSFPARVGGDPRVAAVIGRPGQTVVELRFTPASSNLQLAMICAHGGQESDRPDIASTTTVNGHDTGGTSCTGDRLQPEGFMSFDQDDAARNSRIWTSELGVEPGRESVARFTYTGGPAPDVQLGLAVYELSGARVMAGSKALERTISMNGRRYTLEAFEFHQLTARSGAAARRVTLPGKAGPGFVVCAGTPGDPARGSDLLRFDGRVESGSSSGGYFCTGVDGGAPVTAQLEASGYATGTAVIAAYRPER